MEATWLKHAYTVNAADVVPGDSTYMGTAIELRSDIGAEVAKTHVAIRYRGNGAGKVYTDTVLRDHPVTLLKMVDPIGRGAPSWCVR